MNRLIDADTVVTIQVYDDMTEVTDTKKMTIAEAIDEWSDEGCPPTVDAVPVVRCKDCLYRVGNACDYSAVYVRPNGYCQWGRNKENETD